jgi:hypothetical protein
MYLLGITVIAFQTASMMLQNMHASQSPRNNDRSSKQFLAKQSDTGQSIYKKNI